MELNLHDFNRSRIFKMFQFGNGVDLEAPIQNNTQKKEEKIIKKSGKKLKFNKNKFLVETIAKNFDVFFLENQAKYLVRDGKLLIFTDKSKGDFLKSFVKQNFPTTTLSCSDKRAIIDISKF